MNELTRIEVNELQNTKLQTQLKNINKAIATGEKTRWVIADSIKKIVSEELFVDDFVTEKNLADYLGMSRPNLNKLKRASEYHEIEALKDFNISQIIEMLPVGLDLVEDLLVAMEITTSDSARTIRESVKKYLGRGEEVEEAEEAEEIEEAEEVIVEEATKAEKLAGYVLRLNESQLAELEEFMLEKGWC